MTAPATTPGGAGGPPAESAPLDALASDLRALKSIHRHLSILAEDYAADFYALSALDLAAAWTARSIARILEFKKAVTPRTPTP